MLVARVYVQADGREPVPVIAKLGEGRRTLVFDWPPDFQGAPRETEVSPDYLPLWAYAEMVVTYHAWRNGWRVVRTEPLLDDSVEGGMH